MLSKPTSSINTFLIKILITIQKNASSSPIVDKLYKLFPEQNMSLSLKDKVDFLINAFKHDNEPISIAELMKHISEKEFKQFVSGNKTKIGGRYTKKSTRRKTQKGGFVQFIIKKSKAFLLGSVAAAIVIPVSVIAHDFQEYSPMLDLLGVEQNSMASLIGEYPEVATGLYIVGVITSGIMAAVTLNLD